MESCELRITIMGRLSGKQIDLFFFFFLLEYYVLITLVSLKYKSLQIYKIHLKEGSFQSLHWLVSSLNHLAGPQGVPWPSSSIYHGSFIPFPEASWRHSLGVPHKKMAELVRRSLLNGGIRTTTIRVLRR